METSTNRTLFNSNIQTAIRNIVHQQNQHVADQELRYSFVATESRFRRQAIPIRVRGSAHVAVVPGRVGQWDQPHSEGLGRNVMGQPQASGFPDFQIGPTLGTLWDPLGVKVGSPIFGSLGLEAANHVLIVHPMEARKLMSFGSMWPTEPTATWKIASRFIKHRFVTWWKSAVLVVIVLYLPNVTHSLGPQAESKEEAVAFEMQDGMGNTPGQLGQCSKPRC